MRHMRLRLPELLRAKRWTPYRLIQESGGRLKNTTVHRLVKADGRVTKFDADVCDALCDVLGVGPGELFER